MTEQFLKHAANVHHSPVAVARLDWESAQLIDESVKLQRMHGTQHAADFLKDRNINIDIALRVLLEPGKRRIYAESANS